MIGARAFGPGSRTFLSERAGFSRRIRRPHPGLSRGEREQTAVGTLSASFRAEPDPAQVKRLLGMLDTSDLGSRFPKADMKMRRVLTELVRFQEAGEMPRMSETEQQELEKARKNVKT